MSAFKAARTLGRLTSARPMSARIAGRTNSSKETYEDTGLPGRASRGVWSGPTVPKPCGLPGCIASLRKSIRPPSGSSSAVPTEDSASLTTSYAPTLTPPVVTSRSARISWSSMVERSVSASSATAPTR